MNEEKNVKKENEDLKKIVLIGGILGLAYYFGKISFCSQLYSYVKGYEKAINEKEK